MPDFIGWDIGGVHLKAARLSFSGGRLSGARSRLRYFEMWREREGLPDVLRALRQDLGAGAATHAVTMTAELADCFASREEGVLSILRAVEEGLGAEPLRLWSSEGSFAAPRETRERPLAFAAANWLATAEVAARCVGEGLLVDIGSTTTDLVPLAGGHAAPLARDDMRRLVAGELVYSGVLRTPPAALAPEVPLRGAWCRLSPEPFVFMADVYLALGRITPAQVTGPTADGRPPTPEAAQARLARLLCADLDSLGCEPVRDVGRFLESAQLGILERAARQVVSRVGGRPQHETVVATGLGAFLASRLAQRLELPCRDLSEFVPLSDPQAAPATCVALLLAEEALGLRGPEAWRIPA